MRGHAIVVTTLLCGLTIVSCTKKTAQPTEPVSDGIVPQPPGTPAPAGTRDKYKQPFASTSIWNTAIGSGANYVSTGFQAAGALQADQDYFFCLESTDPVTPIYDVINWGHRCQSTKYLGGLTLNLPADLIVPDATSSDTPNNATAFLLPDWRHLVQLNAFARCTAGGPGYGYWTTWGDKQDIYLDGIRGAHAGSGLSSIGGTIRLGELTGPEPIRHALKVNVFADKYLSYSGGGYRWPADRSDDDAATTYKGTNAAIRMGTLLAIPPQVAMSELGLQTEPAKKLFWTLQNYGAYIVDNTAWDAYALAVEHGVPQEFRTAYGHEMHGYASLGAWFSDVMKLFQALQVVENNSSTSIGGGGTPLQPAAPPIGN